MESDNMTPHNEAELGSIATTVLMPGDPLRVKYIADNFLTDSILVNKVRNMYAYTGFYKGKKITVMASGMGMPSIGIYSYELYKFYNVENIIRIGSSGSYSKDVKLFDIILASESYTLSSYAKTQGYNKDVISSNEYLNNKIIDVSNRLNKEIKIGRVHSTDVFYEDIDINDLYNNKGCLCCEMESFALFYNARKLNKRASALLTISDSLVTKEVTTSEEREKSFNDMIILALESAISL